MMRRQSPKPARSFPISSQISICHSSLAHFSNPNILSRFDLTHTFLSCSCFEELHFLDVLTAPEENYLTAYRESLFQTAINMSQGMPVGNPTNSGDLEEDYRQLPYNPTFETRAMVRPRGSSEEPPSQRPAEKRRALNPPELNAIGSVSASHEMIWDMDMNALFGNSDADALAVSHSGSLPSTPQPHVAVQSYSDDSDLGFCHWVNNGYGSQVPVDSGMLWHGPMPVLSPSPTTFLPYRLTPVGAPQLGMTPQDSSPSDICTPSKPKSKSKQVMSPLAPYTRGDLRPLVANFPALLLQGLGRTRARITSDSASGSTSTGLSILGCDSPHGLSQGDPLPMVEDALESSDTGSNIPTDSELLNEAAPTSTQTLTQKPYARWEDSAIINHWAGPMSSIERIERSLAAGRTPRDEDRLDEEWKTLASGPLKCRRTALALARHWTSLVQGYFSIRSMGSSVEPDADNSGQAIAARALAQARSAKPTDKVVGNMKALSVIEWCSEATGWFETMHAQLRYFKAPSPGSKDSWPPIPYPMATQPHTIPSVFGTSSTPLHIFGATPPPPSSTSQGHSAMGSGTGRMQPTQTPHGAPDPLPPRNQPRAPVGTASTWEMARDNHAVAESQMGVLAQKEDYLKGRTVLSHIMAMRELMEMQFQSVNFRSKWLMKFVEVPVPELRGDSIAVLRQIHIVEPVSAIDFDLLLNNIEVEMKRRGMIAVDEE